MLTRQQLIIIMLFSVNFKASCFIFVIINGEESLDFFEKHFCMETAQQCYRKVKKSHYLNVNPRASLNYCLSVLVLITGRVQEVCLVQSICEERAGERVFQLQ